MPAQLRLSAAPRSLGGKVSVAARPAANAVFDAATAADDGVTEYRCLFVYNPESSTLPGVEVAVAAIGGADVAIGVDPETSASVATADVQVVADERTAPAGVVFGAVAAIGNLNANRARAVWLRRTAGQRGRAGMTITVTVEEPDPGGSGPATATMLFEDATANDFVQSVLWPVGDDTVVHFDRSSGPAGGDFRAIRFDAAAGTASMPLAADGNTGFHPDVRTDIAAVPLGDGTTLLIVPNHLAWDNENLVYFVDVPGGAYLLTVPESGPATIGARQALPDEVISGKLSAAMLDNGAIVLLGTASDRVVSVCALTVDAGVVTAGAPLELDPTYPASGMAGSATGVPVAALAGGRALVGWHTMGPAFDLDDMRWRSVDVDDATRTVTLAGAAFQQAATSPRHRARAVTGGVVVTLADGQWGAAGIAVAIDGTPSLAFAPIDFPIYDDGDSYENPVLLAGGRIGADVQRYPAGWDAATLAQMSFTVDADGVVSDEAITDLVPSPTGANYFSAVAGTEAGGRAVHFAVHGIYTDTSWSTELTPQAWLIVGPPAP